MSRFANFKFSLRDHVRDSITNQNVQIYKKEYSEELINNTDQIKIIKAYYIKHVNGKEIEPDYRQEHLLKSIYL